MGSLPSTSQQKSKPFKVSAAPQKIRVFRIQQLAITEEDKKRIQQIMKKHCLLTILNEKLNKQSLNHFTKWIYSSGRYIYRQHDIAQEMFLIGAGNVSVEIDCSIVKSLGDGQYFGHQTVCFDCPRSESIRVITSEIILYSIKKEKIMPMIQQVMLDYKEDINRLFNHIHFFNYLTNKQRKFLINSTQLFRLNPNQILFEKEQNANSFYVVRKNNIIIQIDHKKDISMKEGDYFGESAFIQLLNNTNKSQRMGKAIAAKDGSEVYAIGLSPVKVCLGYYIRSIIFFNQQKWALYRNEYISCLPNVDYYHLLQLFNVKEGKKYSALAKKGSKVKYIFIPLEVEINKSRELKIYGAELILKNQEQQIISYDVILTDNGYYAYALIDDFRRVLSLQPYHESTAILKRPLYLGLTLTLRNLSNYSKKLKSSDFSIVLIAEDMKFGNQFIVKIYRKKQKASVKHFPSENLSSSQSLKRFTSRSYSKKLTMKIKKCPSKASLFISHFENDDEEKKILDEICIRRERDIVANLCSDYICGFYKGQEDQNNYYLFLQHITGSKLEDIIDTFGIIPYKVIKYILASIANALQYLHTNHIVYRNLNPNDIIIRNNGKIALIDFSCAKKLEDTHKTSTLIGTPFYMAPEVIRQDDYTYNSDIWSMGIVLYEMLTGRTPFGHGKSDPIQIYQQILHGQLQLKSIPNKNQKKILINLLQKDALKRIKNPLQIRNFAYMDDLQFQWTQFLKDNLRPSYFPPSSKIDFTNISNEDIFDGINVKDWN